MNGAIIVDLLLKSILAMGVSINDINLEGEKGSNINGVKRGGTGKKMKIGSISFMYESHY